MMAPLRHYSLSKKCMDGSVPMHIGNAMRLFSFALLCFLKYTEFEGKVVGEMEVFGMKQKEINLIKTHYMCICNSQTINKKL